MPLISTPGAVDANSYPSLAEAVAYMGARLHTSAWDSASSTDRTKALQMATRLLDAKFVWTGSAATDTQALGWPRNGMFSRNGFPILNTVIPQSLKDATSEFALQLMGADRSLDNSVALKGITKIKAGSAEIEYRDDLEAGLREYIIPDAVLSLLVPSWYVGGVPVDSGKVFRVL